MIPIKETVRVLNPSRRGPRAVALFRFYSDESYESDSPPSGSIFYDLGSPYVPKAFVVGGVFADAECCSNIETPWDEENHHVGVSRYHGAYVNARSGEFEDWNKERQRTYSINLVSILRAQKKRLHVISCGMFVGDYRATISETGRVKFGTPYIACFKECISMIACGMEMPGRFEPDDKFAVILDRNEQENEAVEVFYKMKDSTSWPPHRRLATCAPGGWQDHILLQPADLIAYESFRLLRQIGIEGGAPRSVRPALRSMFPDNAFLSYYFDKEMFEQFKRPLEEASCGPNEFFVNFPPLPDEDEQ